MSVAPASDTGQAHGSTVDTLRIALDQETRLLTELASVLRHQRAGVASDDVQVVDDSVFATHRVLRTLEQARRRRHTIIGLLAGADVSIRELDQALGMRMTHDLVDARDRLEAAAQDVSREIRINREVLRHAIETGDGLVRALCGATAAPGQYDAAGTASARPGGTIINQRV